jgi:Fic family protein
LENCCDKHLDRIDGRMMERVVLTHKSGKFVFSAKFSHETLLPSLVELGVLYSTVRDLPILPDIAAQIENEIVRRSIFGTAAIEGNPLTEERVGQIISESNGKRKKDRAEKEIENLKSAHDHVAGLRPLDTPPILTEELIKEIHFRITRDIEHEYNIPGQYRSHVVKVGDAEHGGIYTPPKCLADIKSLMKEYVDWINTEEIVHLGPAVRAALAHYYIGLIHPFADGNGRAARLVEALLLRLTGMKYVPTMLSNFYYRNVDDYFRAFSKSVRNKENDVTDFLGFVLKGAVDSLNEIKGRIIFFIRKFTLRDYYAALRRDKGVTSRQHDLMKLLLDYMKPFRLEDLFNASPFNILYRHVSERTARRDLGKLKEMGLLVVNNGKYELNFFVLG